MYQSGGNHPATNVNFDVDVGANLCVCPNEQANHRVCPPAQCTDVACRVSTLARAICRDGARPVSTPADQNVPKVLKDQKTTTTPTKKMAGSDKLIKNKGGYRVRKWAMAAAFACLLVMNAVAQNSGQTGLLTWEFNSGALTISVTGGGTAAMPDYEFDEDTEMTITPWSAHTFDITSVVIDDGVTSIGDMAFAMCIALANVEIPNSVTTIGYGALAYTALTDVSMPGVITIGDAAFVGCVALVSVSMPGVITIGEAAFAMCEALAYVEMPKIVTIGEAAFMECIALTSITLPSSLTTIGDYAFEGCIGLTAFMLSSFIK